jgi:hypothetical protein
VCVLLWSINCVGGRTRGRTGHVKQGPRALPSDRPFGAVLPARAPLPPSKRPSTNARPVARTSRRRSTSGPEPPAGKLGRDRHHLARLKRRGGAGGFGRGGFGAPPCVFLCPSLLLFPAAPSSLTPSLLSGKSWAVWLQRGLLDKGPERQASRQEKRGCGRVAHPPPAPRRSPRRRRLIAAPRSPAALPPPLSQSS